MCSPRTPDALWRMVLRRQEGEMAFLATYPDDPGELSASR